MSLMEYINEHIERGACTCGQCCDNGLKPKENQPEGASNGKA